MEDISSAVVSELDLTLSNPETLEVIANEIQKRAHLMRAEVWLPRRKLAV